MSTQTKPRVIRGERVYHRTKQLDLGRASSFALALGKNKRFSEVEIVEGGRGGWHVLSLPANQDRQEALRAAEQAERQARADEQGPGFVWTRTAAGWECFNPVSGGRYLVSADRCACHDWYRCNPLQVNCKHQLDGFKRGHLRIETDDERRARVQADRERDFCDG